MATIPAPVAQLEYATQSLGFLPGRLVRGRRAGDAAVGVLCFRATLPGHRQQLKGVPRLKICRVCRLCHVNWGCSSMKALGSTRPPLMPWQQSSVYVSRFCSLSRRCSAAECGCHASIDVVVAVAISGDGVRDWSCDRCLLDFPRFSASESSKSASFCSSQWSAHQWHQ